MSVHIPHIKIYLNFMCDKGYTYHDFEDYEEAEKKCI